MEQKRGFVNDMMDVKILTLYTLIRLEGTADFNTLLEVCLQDDGVGFFELREAVTQLGRTGHVTEAEGEVITITPLGREHCAVTEDSLALPLRQKLNAAVEAWNARQARQRRVIAQTAQNEDGSYSSTLRLKSPVGDLMYLELASGSLNEARKLCKTMEAQAEDLYSLVLNHLLEAEAARRRD